MLFLVTFADARPNSEGWVDSSTHEIRCHWVQAEDEVRCQELLSWAELAWDVQVTELGFHPPYPDQGEGGSDSLDIYLSLAATGGAGSAWVDCDYSGWSCADADPEDGRAGAPAYVAIDARNPDEDLGPFTVHEFNHVLQYATDYSSALECAR